MAKGIIRGHRRTFAVRSTLLLVVVQHALFPADDRLDRRDLLVQCSLFPNLSFEDQSAHSSPLFSASLAPSQDSELFPSAAVIDDIHGLLRPADQR